MIIQALQTFNNITAMQFGLVLHHYMSQRVFISISQPIESIVIKIVIIFHLTIFIGIIALIMVPIYFHQHNKNNSQNPM